MTASVADRERVLLARGLGSALLAALIVAAPAPAGAADDESVDLGALEEEVLEDESEEAASATSGEPEEVGDVVDQLGAGSGVRVNLVCTNCNAANLVVNGLSGDHVKVTFDGIETPGGLGTVFFLTQYPSDFVGYTGVGRGPGSVLTGSAAIAGTIDLHSAKRDEQRALLNLELGDWGWRQLKAVGMDRWSDVGLQVFVQGATQDRLDANGDAPGSGGYEVAEFERYTYHGILDVGLTDYQTLTLSGLFYGEDQLDGPGAALLDADRQYWYINEDAFFNWRNFTGQWRMERPSGLQLDFDAQYSRRGQQQWTVRSLSGLDPANPQPDRDSQDMTYSIEDEMSLASFTAQAPVGTAGYLTGTLGWSKQRLRVLQINDGFQPYWIVDGLEHLEAALQYERSVGARWDYAIGLRYDDMSVFGRAWADTIFDPPTFTEETGIPYSYVSPRGQFHYRPNDKLVLGLAVGRGIQTPKPSFAETCCGAKYQRNLDLVPERSWTYQWQTEWKPIPDMRLTNTLFWSDFDDYHEKIVYKSSAFVPYYSNTEIASARVRGFDLVHDMRFKGDLFNVGWTYAYVESDDGAGMDLRYIPNHTGSAYFRYGDLLAGRSLSFDATYTGGMYHYELFESHLETQPPVFTRSDAFWTFNTRYEQRIGRKGWNAYVGITNITDYTMPDLGDTSTAFDWGPITGRFIYAGAKFLR